MTIPRRPSSRASRTTHAEKPTYGLDCATHVAGRNDRGQQPNSLPPKGSTHAPQSLRLTIPQASWYSAQVSPRGRAHAGRPSVLGGAQSRARHRRSACATVEGIFRHPPRCVACTAPRTARRRAGRAQHGIPLRRTPTSGSRGPAGRHRGARDRGSDLGGWRVPASAGGVACGAAGVVCARSAEHAGRVGDRDRRHAPADGLRT